MNIEIKTTKYNNVLIWTGIVGVVLYNNGRKQKGGT
jgi:hypothetical protein